MTGCFLEKHAHVYQKTEEVGQLKGQLACSGCKRGERSHIYNLPGRGWPASDVEITTILHADVYKQRYFNSIDLIGLSEVVLILCCSKLVSPGLSVKILLNSSTKLLISLIC